MLKGICHSDMKFGQMPCYYNDKCPPTCKWTYYSFKPIIDVAKRFMAKDVKFEASMKRSLKESSKFDWVITEEAIFKA